MKKPVKIKEVKADKLTLGKVTFQRGRAKPKNGIKGLKYHKKENAWFTEAWKASQEQEAQRKAEEIKYLVRRLYELIF